LTAAPIRSGATRPTADALQAPSIREAQDGGGHVHELLGHTCLAQLLGPGACAGDRFV
jgi:hypothetical protein